MNDTPRKRIIMRGLERDIASRLIYAEGEMNTKYGLNINSSKT